MTNIYNKINDIDFNVDSLELNDIEREKMISNAKSYAKKDYKKKLLVSAATVLLFAGLMTPSVRAEVAKFTTDIKVSMMDAFGASPDSYKYVTELNKPVTVGNDSFVIGNIAFEDNKVFINTLRDSDGSVEGMMDDSSDIYKIVIDGQSYVAQGGSGSRGFLEDGKTISDVSVINFDKEFPSYESIDVDLYFTDYNNTNEIISIKANINTVNEDNVVYAKDLKLDNGAEIELLKLNSITMTAIIKNLDPNYIYELIGMDKDGNSFTLEPRSGDDNELTFLYNKDISDMSLDQIRNADEIRFIFKAASLDRESANSISGEYENIAEFTYKVE